MSSPEFPLGKSRVVSGRYPPPGTDPIADAIRERRGARGITPLDANLLHIPPVAAGFNTMLGAIRTKGKLPGDIRETMILRVAAINHAAFEWVHHVVIGRQEGLSTGQLYIIRDTNTPLPPLKSILTPLQTIAIEFTDHSTRSIRVPMAIIDKFKTEIRQWALAGNPSLSIDDLEAKVEDLYVEAAMVVASYNMVSRFLLSTDVAGISDKEVPWPIDKKEHFVSLPSFPPASTPTHIIHAVTLITSPTAPWLVFANSLLTDWSMWSYVIPHFLDLISSSDGTTFNILLHSQRGHGQSTLPPNQEGHDRLTTIPLLATDIANLLQKLSIPTPVHSVIGVSQGGAATLAFAALYGEKSKSIVVCDTAPSTPAGNKEAWEERIRLVRGSVGNTLDMNTEYSQRAGIRKLVDVTVPRWFPPGSTCNRAEASGAGLQTRVAWIEDMVAKTDVNGFIHGARALGDYDVHHLISSTPSDGSDGGLFSTRVSKILLLAGQLDGGGKVGNGLQGLCSRWNYVLEQAHNGGSHSSTSVAFVGVENAGHLPMIDSPDDFCRLVSPFFSEFCM